MAERSQYDQSFQRTLARCGAMRDGGIATATPEEHAIPLRRRLRVLTIVQWWASHLPRAAELGQWPRMPEVKLSPKEVQTSARVGTARRQGAHRQARALRGARRGEADPERPHYILTETGTGYHLRAPD